MSRPANPFLSASGKDITCMEMLQLVLDGEVTEEQRAYFDAHMEQCMPCFKAHEVDMSIKQLVKTNCCGDGAPLELLNEIREKISKMDK